MVWIFNLLAACGVGVLLREVEVSLIGSVAGFVGTFFVLMSLFCNTAILSQVYVSVNRAKAITSVASRSPQFLKGLTEIMGSVKEEDKEEEKE